MLCGRKVAPGGILVELEPTLFTSGKIAESLKIIIKEIWEET